MSILVDNEIRHLSQSRWTKSPMIEPFSEDQLQPASYDVILGNVFQVVDKHRLRAVDLGDPSTFDDLYDRVEVPDSGCYSLPSKCFVLACTRERVCIPPYIVGTIESKSSVARLGLIIETAGYIDCGFEGVITMELYNQLPVPILLRPGVRIAQFTFTQTSNTPDRVYGDDGLGSHYQGDDETVGSRFGT